MSRLKIAITCKDSSRIWSNGLTQNAYNLILLLKKANYKVVDAVSQFEEAGKKLENFEIKKLTKENIKNYDIILEVCYSLTDGLFDFAKANGVKVVTINYGNILMLMQEDFILSPDRNPAINRGETNSWISPHFEFSKGFVEATSKGQVDVCPYIWSSEIFKKYFESKKINPFYSGPKNLKKIGVFESNINMIKTCIYPLISIEKLERKDSSIISEVLFFNAISLKENAKFKEITKNFDIFNSGKLSVEGRYPLPDMLAKGFVGTIVSHQFYCDLNYLTLEALYTGNPIIHNSEFCKEAGYYYELFDAEGCANQIQNAIENHDTKIEEYRKASKEVIHKFSYDNPQNIAGYKKLINNLN